MQSRVVAHEVTEMELEEARLAEQERRRRGEGVASTIVGRMPTINGRPYVETMAS